MECPKFSCTVSPTDALIPLGFEVWISDQRVFNCDHVMETQSIVVDLPSDSQDSKHALKLVLKNKLPQHTQVTASGDIEHDAVLSITDLKFDGIDINYIVNQQAVYTHSFNGNGAIIQDQFFGVMGCNGTVELKFSTPIYLWILENM